MKNLSLPRAAEPRQILQSAAEQKTIAIMTYLSDRRWHVAKVIFTELGANKLSSELLQDKNPRPINIRPEQPVGISLKHAFGKLVFETKVISLEPSPNAASGGMLILAVPDRVEIIERRSYFRVQVPASLKVKTVLWHRDQKDLSDAKISAPDKRYWQADLLDISAGGTQIAIDASQKQFFKKGQFLTLRFTPMPYEMPIMFNAQIRNILATADNKTACLGLQIVGLEASCEGHETLHQLCKVVEQYYKMNQACEKNRTNQPASISG